MKYRVDTETWNSQEFTDLQKAEGHYEFTKDQKMGEGVYEDSYVELVSSGDDFEDYQVLKRAIVVRDEDKIQREGSPKDQGFDFEYWAKWREVTE